MSCFDPGRRKREARYNRATATGGVNLLVHARAVIDGRKYKAEDNCGRNFTRARMRIGTWRVILELLDFIARLAARALRRKRVACRKGV